MVACEPSSGGTVFPSRWERPEGDQPVARARLGYTVEMGVLPGRLAVRADPETARRLFHTLLCFFPSPSSLSITYREGRAARTRSRLVVSRAAIAEAFEALCEFILRGRGIQFAVRSETPSAELHVAGGGELQVVAEDLGPFERVVEEFGLPALRGGRIPAAPRLGARSPLAGESVTLHNVLERLRLAPTLH